MLGRCRRDQGSGSPAQLIPVQCNLLRRGAAAACTNHRTAVWVCSLLSAFKPTDAMQIFLSTLLAVILLLYASFYHSLLCIH